MRKGASRVGGKHGPTIPGTGLHGHRRSMKIDSSEIPNYLTAEMGTNIDIKNASGALVARANTSELLHLAALNLVIGEVQCKYKKHKLVRTHFSFAIVRERPMLIHRRLHDMRRPVLPSSVISKMRQAKGSKRWVERLDKADAGRTATRTTIPHPLNQPDWTNTVRLAVTECLSV